LPLTSFSTQALAYWWRRYIEDTECIGADTAYDARYSVAEREEDTDFIYYMTLICTENLGNVGYIFLNSVASTVPAEREAQTKLRVRGAVLLLAFMLDEHDKDEIPEMINDWRIHITRLVNVSLAAESVSTCCLQFSSKGPELFSEYDKNYCALRGIVESRRLPRT